MLKENAVNKNQTRRFVSKSFAWILGFIIAFTSATLPVRAEVSKQAVTIHRGVYDNRSCRSEDDYLIENKYPDAPMPADGEILDYYLENGRIKGINGLEQLDFIITSTGELRVGKRHIFLANRQPVLAAGQLELDECGKIKKIDNLSGHYQPTVQQAMRFQALLSNLGADLRNTLLTYYTIKLDSSGFPSEAVLVYSNMIK